jgi:hypothetical protein
VEQIVESPNGLFDSMQTAGTIIRSKFPRFPAEQQPMTRPWRCGGVFVILMSIQASIEPIMNVRRIFTGINHLHHHHNNFFVPRVSFKIALRVKIGANCITHKVFKLWKVMVSPSWLTTSAGPNR